MPKTFELGPLQREWIRCLRSKEWKQGVRRLCREVDGVVRYCCLGIACEVAKANGVGLVEEHLNDTGEWEFNGAVSVLPECVRRAMKFRGTAGDLLHASLDKHEYLTEANDCGASFKQIADFAEKHPEAVFTGPA